MLCPNSIPHEASSDVSPTRNSTQSIDDVNTVQMTLPLIRVQQHAPRGNPVYGDVLLQLLHQVTSYVNAVTETSHYSLPTDYIRYPGFDNTDEKTATDINSYMVTQLPQVKVYQYDVIIGRGAEKRVVQRKVWNSCARVNATSHDIIYDATKLAWSLEDMNRVRAKVDLGIKDSKPPSPNDKSASRVHLTLTGTLDLEILQPSHIRMSQHNYDDTLSYKRGHRRELPMSEVTFQAYRKRVSSTTKLLKGSKLVRTQAYQEHQAKVLSLLPPETQINPLMSPERSRPLIPTLETATIIRIRPAKSLLK